VIAYPRLYHLAPGRPPLLAVRWPGATGLTSYLSGCLSLTSQRCSLKHRRRFGSLARLACSRILPGSNAHFVTPFSAFRLAGSFYEPPESPAPCWRTVATVYPLGNCDSLKTETSLSYLTRLETVSNRCSPLSSFFAFTDSARTPPEELVNSASASRPCDRFQEGLSQPA
jgi:hypothetical protein